MRVFLQQLGGQGLLNNLFMVEARVSNDDELHTNDDTIVVHNTQTCLEKKGCLTSGNYSKKETRALGCQNSLAVE